ncbi:odorant receptor 94b-like isoform X2 [Temnothorax curvispinosus]|uniref:Odorant receptor 94b-like isoform X2 n=1 Tax=Temnothorax curvispinosus TaxID=300111 RepID=A0A6J1Q8Z3_9HYME|nr:odorant receptor 94b-like isoform X2 [Temnothorax curvispinosus]XP_024879342.1 odorant receptor 94b-like isoform X2 [Temnothorax curvispinosus]
MQILPLNFLLYTISGLWRPLEWSSKYSKLLYSVYTYFMIYLMAYFMLATLLYIIFVIDNVEDFASGSLFFFCAISILPKAITAVIYRDEIINLVKTLQEKPCKACNKDETDIQNKFDRSIRSYTIYYILLCMFSLLGAVAAAVLVVLEGQLPYNMWVPWDCTSFLLFWFTSLQNILALIVGTIVNVATETLWLGFCLQTCAQFEILKYRLQNMTKRREEEIFPKNSLNNASRKIGTLSEHISHHLCIIRAFSMFVQIFFYCWAGNEVTLKSTGLSEVVYHMNWMLMTISEQKNLLMIMKRSTKPVKLTSSFLVTLSLESFGNLLKASFSAFNVLQQF